MTAHDLAEIDIVYSDVNWKAYNNHYDIYFTNGTSVNIVNGDVDYACTVSKQGIKGTIGIFYIPFSLGYLLKTSLLELVECKSVEEIADLCKKYPPYSRKCFTERSER